MQRRIVSKPRFSKKEKSLTRQLYNELRRVKSASDVLSDSETSILVLTININNYDTPLSGLESCIPSANVLYLIITDNASAKGPNVVNVGPYLSKEDGVLASRFFKFSTYTYLDLFQYVVYVDSNYHFAANFLLRLKHNIQLLPNANAYFFDVVPARTTLEELFYCAECGKISGTQIAKLFILAQITRFPSLSSTTIDGSFFIIHRDRKTLAKAFKQVFLSYWRILRRDQLFLATACTSPNIKVIRLPGCTSQNSFGAYRQTTHTYSDNSSPLLVNKVKIKIHSLLYSEKQIKLFAVLRLILLLLKP